MKTYIGAVAALVPMLLLGEIPAAQAADPLNDPTSILTLQTENDAYSLPGTDRYYTAGQSLGYVTPTGDLPGPLAALGHAVFGSGSQRLEIDLQQVIYTPVDTQAYDPNPHDRPYAGQLALHTSIIQDTASTRSVLQASLGVVGPDALGQPVQNGFHEFIGDTSAKGWSYQLHNEPTLDFMASRTWRYDLANFDQGALTLQMLSQASAQVGNTEIYGQVGSIVRLGSGLDSDFGPSVIGPVMSGTEAYTPTQPFVWYVFGGVSGRLVAHDMLVQGNDFQSSRGVGLIPAQGDAEVGLAVILFGLRISATEIFTTPEFHGAAPAFQYGSVTISARF
ncbi:MAG: lipid A deacylase LpxR family protein [Acidocella sp.]|nr:lipid A deacylase LpxR family protein [Acidocella sp.]